MSAYEKCVGVIAFTTKMSSRCCCCLKTLLMLSLSAADWVEVAPVPIML